MIPNPRALARSFASKTAAATYATRQAAIAETVAALQAALAQHAARQQNDSRNWGYAGDLGEIHARLTEALNFISPSA